MIEFDIHPCSAPRQSQGDKFNPSKRVLDYRAFCDMLWVQARNAGYILDNKIPLSICFTIQMPKSWTKKKKLEMNGKAHTQTPDTDNLIKAFKDALAKQDSHIWSYGGMKKIWGREPKITVYQDWEWLNKEFYEH